jgi:hypothetical protein
MLVGKHYIYSTFILRCSCRLGGEELRREPWETQVSFSFVLSEGPLPLSKGSGPCSVLRQQLGGLGWVSLPSLLRIPLKKSYRLLSVSSPGSNVIKGLIFQVLGFLANEI